MHHTAALALALVAIGVCLHGAHAQKGAVAGQRQNSYASPAPPLPPPSSSAALAGGAPASPVSQFRQNNEQVQYNTNSYAPQRPAAAVAQTKRRPVQQQQQQVYNNQQQDNNGQQQVEPNTEDPLADSEPALYGSVAGTPGVDFPAYTRIPKTSFTCDGKGFDFGFYADEEAQCQVYHVCWSGRRESFLCGVGTVFNQAILACDYWHSVDCSKTSQYFGVNSELGKCECAQIDNHHNRSIHINNKK